jgi:hypothetical protein
MAHRVISQPRSKWVAFGAKRTRAKSAATKTVQITGAASDPRLAGGVSGKSVLNRFRPNLGADHGPVPGGSNPWAVWGPLPRRAFIRKIAKFKQKAPSTKIVADFSPALSAPQSRCRSGPRALPSWGEGHQKSGNFERVPCGYLTQVSAEFENFFTARLTLRIMTGYGTGQRAGVLLDRLTSIAPQHLVRRKQSSTSAGRERSVTSLAIR